MPQSGYVPGAATYSPLLTRAALSTAPRSESFVGGLIMPDTRVETFAATAPIYGNEELEAWDDDIVGRASDFLESLVSEGSYDFSIGSHGRKATIPQQDIAKALEAQRVARAFGNGDASQVFDLKRRATNTMLLQNARHNELLILALTVSSANYSVSHVLGTLNVRTSAVVRETIIGASNLIEADTGEPANVVIFGVGARDGAQMNANLLTLLPDDAIKVLTRDALKTILGLPEGGQVAFATAKVKRKASSVPEPMMNNFIWVGRTVPAEDSVNATFGRNYWKPDHRNGQRIYVNEQTWGVQENVSIGVINHYQPQITGKDYGVLIPTVSTP
jgi:hypothetical protein